MRINILLPALLLSVCVSAQNKEPNYAVDLVNPFVGTGGHGHTFPGATAPFGLVQLSPDTRISPVEWDGCGGYHYSDAYIYGFSHTHLSGTGVSDLADVLVQPMSGSFSFDSSIYRSKFSHEKEKAYAGFYSVHLNDEDIDVELTTTPRVGMHRYTYNSSKAPWLVLDLDHRDKVLKTSIKVKDGWEIVGERSSSSWAKDQRLFYCIRANHPIVEDSINGNKAAFRFDLNMSPRFMRNSPNLKGSWRESDKQLILKVGISSVSVEGARQNLESEIPHWNFDQVANEAVERWNEKLGKIKLKGGTPEQQRIFYTALYHCYVAPYLFSDVDGRYRGMDGAIHSSERDVYTVFSLWDTFRALHPLMTILEPDITSDWINTMLLNYKDGGRLPVWELWGNETDCMIGYHSVSMIADAYAKGIEGFDAELALAAMMGSADRDQPGLNALREKGYIGSEDEAESVSKTLEYAYDDACINSFYSKLRSNKGQFDYWRSDTAKTFSLRARAWENLLDPTSGFFRPRKNGGFVEPFDPYEVNFHFTEANAWQYSLFVPHGIDNYQHYARDRSKQDHDLYERLNAVFEANESTTGREQADITGLIGQYVHGNEPSHHMAYLYNYAGHPEKTRTYVKRILEEMYADTPDGIIGNEDCGQMSAWYVLSSMGFYPVSPGTSTTYDLGYPLFDEATIALPNGKEWKMTIEPKLKKQDGQRVSYPTSISHSQILRGGVFLLSEDRQAHPVRTETSAILDGEYMQNCDRGKRGAPLISTNSASFQDSLRISLRGCFKKCQIKDASGIKACPAKDSFFIRASSMISLDWSDSYKPVEGYFHRIDNKRSIKLQSEYANQYAAGGDNALIDGIRGSVDFRTGDWQGYQGQDVVFEIDLGDVKRLDSISVGVLQDQNSWIWYPEQIEIITSTNQRQWSSGIVSHDVQRREEGNMTLDLSIGLDGRKAQYIRIIAKNAGPCPEWHLGAGGKSWIFLDEVVIRERGK